MKKLSIIFVTLLALLMQVRVAYACEMMVNLPVTHCCCHGEHGHKAATPAEQNGTAPCCKVELTADPGLGSDAKVANSFAKVLFEPLAPPPAPLVTPEPLVLALAPSFVPGRPAPQSSGTDTYLITARLRL